MSQRDKKSITIGTRTFDVMMLSPKVARHIAADLIRILGPSLGALAGKGGISAAMESEVDLGKAIQMATTHLDNDTLDRHFDALAKVTMVDGVPLAPVFEAVFQGDFGGQIEFYAFAMRANFSDFGPALARAFAPLAGAEPVKAQA